MAKDKHLDATGKGEYLYDFKNDILMFKVKDRDYKMSIEFQNFVSDIDEEGFVTGIRIFDASKVFGIDRYYLKWIVHVEFKARVESNVITIAIQFVTRVRNKIFPLLGHKETFKQQITTPIGSYQIEDSLVECPTAVVA